MKKIFAFIFSFTGLAGFAQTYTQSSATTTALYATTCSGTYVDNGGAAGNYSDGLNNSYTFYPAVAANYIRITFNSFSLIGPGDYLAIYDGPGGPLIGQYTNTPGVFTVTASASNSTHGLTCRFKSNGSINSTGWSATVSCTAVAGAAPAFTPSSQDCEQGGGMTICSNSNLTANSSGGGATNDLPNPMNGCLNGGENQTSWYYFSPSSAGTVGFTIAPANGTDDYDFAVWGPYTNVECPTNVATMPLRCSYSGAGGNTGCGNGAMDLSEGALGDGFVQTFPVLAGQVYVMVIDNFSTSSNPFTLSWNLTGGANLNCSVLPVEFLNFTGEISNDAGNLHWQTASELNNDHFEIERSVQGNAFEKIGTTPGAGTSTQIHSYGFTDANPEEGWNYYRIRQVDVNGHTTVSNTLALNFHSTKEFVESVHPVPSGDLVYFDFVSPEGSEIHYQVTDCTGRIVTDKKIEMVQGENAIEINMSENEKGIYFLRVMNDKTNYSFITRLVKY
jgi:hypothetical protein